MSDLSHIPDEFEGFAVEPAQPDTAARKPRLAIMGEFSAGKSTLSNLLIGSRPLPERVTATRLSPVWLTYGQAQPKAVGVEGGEMPIDIEDLDQLDVDRTRYVSMSVECPLLEQCDLLDFPGISDPNMDSDVWERMLPEVDMVLWCTHATQAWRQSEAAAWELIPETVRARSMLLVTRFDKLVTERDRGRVLARLASETDGLFSGIYPVALLQALKATEENDTDAWNASGAMKFSDDLHVALGQFAPNGTAPSPSAAATVSPSPTETAPRAGGSVMERIVPRRVRPRLQGASRRERPSA